MAANPSGLADTLGFLTFTLRLATGEMGFRGPVCTAAILSRSCPLWVRSRHSRTRFGCPLYPRKRTLIERVGKSALCQKRTHALQQNCVLINSEAELAIRNHGSTMRVRRDLLIISSNAFFPA